MPPSPLWSPNEERRSRAHITRFQGDLEAKLGKRFANYGELHRWSCEESEYFWREVWRFCDLIGDLSTKPALQMTGDMSDARWFEGGTLNFAENLLRRDDDAEAVVDYNEQGVRRALTFRQLREAVSALSGFLRSAGVAPGDRVAGYVTNQQEALIAMLATASLGATWSATSPDFGVSGALERFEQIEPKILFATESYSYNGKTFQLGDKILELVNSLPSVTTCILIGEDKLPFARAQAVSFAEALQATPEPWPPKRFAFNQPLYILYSSGTTGKPKCIVHGAGGTLLQHAKEHVLHTDISAGDVVFYYTTCGWMMWNWLVSALAQGATIVLYDGSPMYPSAKALFELASCERITVFGANAKFFAAAEKERVVPKACGEFAGLKTVLSTGSPLSPQSFEYIYREWKSDLCLSSISGGTDIVSCFVLGNPALPVYSGEIQVAGLGMDVSVFDDEGREIVNVPGELVCRRPFPSQPLSFWNDPDRKRYCESYFNVYPGIWRHGDWALRNDRGGFVIYGRSDTTLNPGGVRIGSAEIYRAVEALDEVLECVAVGVRDASDERIALFVKLHPGVAMDETLAQKIRSEIRRRNTPRHVPSFVFAAPDIPKTRNGKIVELAIRQILEGREVKNREAIANPDALEFFETIREEICSQKV